MRNGGFHCLVFRWFHRSKSFLADVLVRLILKVKCLDTLDSHNYSNVHPDYRQYWSTFLTSETFDYVYQQKEHCTRFFFFSYLSKCHFIIASLSFFVGIAIELEKYLSTGGNKEQKIVSFNENIFFQRIQPKFNVAFYVFSSDLIKVIVMMILNYLISTPQTSIVYLWR